MIEAVIYLLAIAAAEAVTVFFVPPWGILCYIVILAIIIVRSALVNVYSHQRLMLPVTLVPLLRIITLAMPLANLPQIWLYPIIYTALFVAAVVVVRILDYKPTQIGLTANWLGIQLVVGGTGFLLGLVAYPILGPEPLIANFAWHTIWLPVLILLLCTGFVEEFVFRGIIQSGAVAAFGRWGIVYVSLLFATLYIRFLSVTWVTFAFIISLYFGWLVKDTKSLLGVALAHGILNVALYLILPFLF